MKNSSSDGSCTQKPGFKTVPMVSVPKNQDFKANPSVYYPVYDPEGVIVHCRHCNKTRKNTKLDIAIRLMELHERGAHNMGEIPVIQEVAHNEPGVTSVS